MLHSDTVKAIKDRLHKVKMLTLNLTCRRDVGMGTNEVFTDARLDENTATNVRQFYVWAASDMEQLLLEREELVKEVRRLQIILIENPELSKPETSMEDDIKNAPNTLYTTFEECLEKAKLYASFEEYPHWRAFAICLVHPTLEYQFREIRESLGLGVLSFSPKYTVMAKYVRYNGAFLREDE